MVPGEMSTVRSFFVVEGGEEGKWWRGEGRGSGGEERRERSDGEEGGGQVE